MGRAHGTTAALPLRVVVVTAVVVVAVSTVMRHRVDDQVLSWLKGEREKAVDTLDRRQTGCRTEEEEFSVCVCVCTAEVSSSLTVTVTGFTHKERGHTQRFTPGREEQLKCNRWGKKHFSTDQT